VNVTTSCLLGESDKLQLSAPQVTKEMTAPSTVYMRTSFAERGRGCEAIRQLYPTDYPDEAPEQPFAGRRIGPGLSMTVLRVASVSYPPVFGQFSG
jgi:hypothetical protein